MKKKITIMLLVISLITTTLFTASFADTTCSPCEEIENIRNSVRSVYDIDAGIYNRLETAILQKYKDVKKGDWYMSVMCKLVGLSAIDGMPGNLMDPNRTITRAMFIKMLIRSMFGANSLNNITPDFDHWAAPDIKKAEQVGILAKNEYTKANIDQPIPRGEMAKLVYRAYAKYEKNPLTLEQCMPLNTVIKDYGQISDTYKPYVLVIYGAGIITGYPDGTYGADKTATRATAAAIVIKYLDTRERAKVTIPSSRAPMVLRQDDPNRPMAIEGDTFIKADGTKVVLKIGPSGVLGEGQGVATEIGRAHPNGKLIKHGDLCSSDEFYGQPYLVDQKTGEGHYREEWNDIANRLIDEALEKHGHPADGTTYGPWLLYKWGCWNWIGPN